MFGGWVALLLDCLIARLLGYCVVRYYVWPQGQAATNFTRWRMASEPYKVCDRIIVDRLRIARN